MQNISNAVMLTVSNVILSVITMSLIKQIAIMLRVAMLSHYAECH
jgi:hypothetical protein